jgi:hypothetical protein
MADRAHFAAFMKGVAAWNAWRAENPDIRPDLSGANLIGANLSGGAPSRPISNEERPRATGW